MASAASSQGNEATISPWQITRRLFRLMARRRLLLVLSIAAGAISALLSLIPYIAVALAIADLLQPVVDWYAILKIGLFAVAGVIGNRLFFGISTALSHMVAFHTQRDLRLDLAAKLERVPLSYMDGRSKGEVRALLVDDIESLEDAMAHLVPEVSAAVIAPLLTIALMFIIDWRLAILLLLPILIGSVMLRRMMQKGERKTQAYFRLMGEVATASAEVADSLPTVRAFNQDEQATARVRSVFARLADFTKEWARETVVPGSGAQVLLSSQLVFVGPAGLMMAAAGMIPVATLAMFLAVAYGFGDLFAAIHGITHRMIMQSQILRRIDDLLDAVELPLPTRSFLPSDASVSVEAVDFAYGERQVLSGVSFEVPEGGFLALVGPSGSGKSTLAKLIARFDDVRVGAIRIGGVDVRDMMSADLYRNLAFIFQDVFLFHGTIAENIRLGRPDATDAEVVAAAHAAQADGFIRKLPLGYETVVGERGYGLSGGERQRISIARAVLKDAPILILDEATAFADPENEALIQDAIAELARGRTLIVIAHRLHTIMSAGQIVVLDDGVVTERGTHDALLADGGLYARLWQAQQEAHAYHHEGKVA